MKKFWLVLLSLGLIIASAASAFAVDVQFTGSMYAAGVYLDKVGLVKDAGSADKSFNTAFFYQRLRVQTDFIAAPGVKIITRFDALERVWSGQRLTPATTNAPDSAGTTTENQNIAVDWAYINYDSPVGTFRVGYMNDGAWGTAFMDSSLPRGKVAWSMATGPWFYTLQIVKVSDNSYSAYNTTQTASDVDSDKYVGAFRYSWKGGEAGLLAGIGRDSSKRPASSYTTQFYTLQPYVAAQLGPVKIQAEVDYFWGDWKKFETASGSDVKLENLAAFLDVTADFGMFYGGLTLAYISGDDPNTTDKLEGNSLLVNGGRDWDPCLIMFNNERTYWMGAITGINSTQNPNVNDAGVPGPAAGMTNAWFFQGKAGVKPTTQLNIYATISYATVDKKPLITTGSDYGWEIDLIATYKLTNNLSYMLGGGYWFVGDYFKGVAPQQAVNNDYMLINKLTLTF